MENTKTARLCWPTLVITASRPAQIFGCHALTSRDQVLAIFTGHNPGQIGQ